MPDIKHPKCGSLLQWMYKRVAGRFVSVGWLCECGQVLPDIKWVQFCVRMPVPKDPFKPEASRRKMSEARKGKTRGSERIYHLNGRYHPVRHSPGYQHRGECISGRGIFWKPITLQKIEILNHCKRCKERVSWCNRCSYGKRAGNWWWVWEINWRLNNSLKFYQSF